MIVFPTGLGLGFICCASATDGTISRQTAATRARYFIGVAPAVQFPGCAVPRMCHEVLSITQNNIFRDHPRQSAEICRELRRIRHPTATASPQRPMSGRCTATGANRAWPDRPRRTVTPRPTSIVQINAVVGSATALVYRSTPSPPIGRYDLIPNRGRNV